MKVDLSQKMNVLPVSGEAAASQCLFTCRIVCKLLVLPIPAAVLNGQQQAVSCAPAAEQKLRVGGLSPLLNMGRLVCFRNYEQIVKAHQDNPNEGKDQVSDEVKFNVFQGIMDSLFQSFNTSISVTNFQELSACVFSWIEEHCKPQVSGSCGWAVAMTEGNGAETTVHICTQLECRAGCGCPLSWGFRKGGM